MELYMRLIEEGVFLFWNDENEAHTFDLKIRIFVGEKKVTILSKKFENGERYFSLPGIGAGEYEIELNGYEGTRLFQTEVKKCTIQSVSQQHAEMMEKLDSIWSAVNCIDTQPMRTILHYIEDPRYLNESTWQWADFIFKLKNDIRNKSNW